MKLVREVPLKVTEYQNTIVKYILFTQFKKKMGSVFYYVPKLHGEGKKSLFSQKNHILPLKLKFCIS